MAKPTKEQLAYLEAKRIVIEYERKHPEVVRPLRPLRKGMVRLRVPDAYKV